MAAKTPESRTQVGIEWCVNQSKELKAQGVPCLHYYTMGDVETIKSIVSQVY
jgi:methylenetetrahydrofolate reductase (NADPH)